MINTKMVGSVCDSGLLVVDESCSAGVIYAVIKRAIERVGW